MNSAQCLEAMEEADTMIASLEKRRDNVAAVMEEREQWGEKREKYASLQRAGPAASDIFEPTAVEVVYSQSKISADKSEEVLINALPKRLRYQVSLRSVNGDPAAPAVD